MKGKIGATLVIAFVLLCSGRTALAAASISLENASATFSTMRPDMGSVFMKISNSAATDDFLIGVALDIKGGIAELHDVQNNAMVKVDRITIPARSSVELKRGGLHIMLFNLPMEVKAGDEVPVTLIFEQAGKRMIRVRIAHAKGSVHGHH